MDELDLGSWTMPDYSSGGGGYQFIGDAADATKLDGVQPGDTSLPWYERLLQYGATRAIDSHFLNQDLTRVQQAQALGIQGANGYTYAPGVSMPILPTTQAGWEKVALFALIGFVAFKLVK
jgi:hypothetical protein